MATNIEEVMFRMGFSTDAINRGVTEMKAKMSDAAEHIAGHMERPRLATRAFHTALHEISKISPLAGEAVMAAFNPVVAAITAGTLVLKAFYDGLKDARAEAKELAKTYEELEKILGAPVSKEKDLAASGRTAEKKAAEDRRRAAKEQGDINDPLEQSLQLLREQEHQFDANRDAAGKLAAQQKLLADVERQRSESQKTVEQYNAPTAIEQRKDIEFRRAQGPKDIASMEKQIEEQKKIQEKTKKFYDEQQEREKAYNEASPEARKYMQPPSYFQKENVDIYKVAVDQEKFLRDAIEHTREAMAKYDEQLAEGSSAHQENFKNLQKLESAHKSLSESVARTQKEIKEGQDKEMFEADSDTFEAIKNENKKKEDEARYQSELGIRLRRMQKEQEKSEIEPYLPTIQELAKTPGWMGMDTGWQMQMNQQMAFNPKMAEFGSMARELQAREADLKRSLLTEGPDSSRAKEDLSRIKSLKSSLVDAGLLKEDKSDKIADRIQDLVDMASIKGHGLKVVPVMVE